MNWRTILAIVMTVAVVGFGAFVAVQNEQLLGEEIFFWIGAESGGSMSLTVGRALLAVFALGAAAVGVAWTFRGSKLAVARAAERKQERGIRRAERSYQEGLESVLAGEDEQALERFRQVLAHDAQHRQALVGAANACRALGRHADALDFRERALALDDRDSVVLAGLAEDHHARGDLARAGSALTRLLDAKPREAPVTAAAAVRLREILVESGDLAGALVAHDRWAKAGDGPAAETNGQPSALVRASIETRKAARDAQEGRTQEARAALRKILKKHPGYSPAWLALGQAFVLEGDEDGALAAWVDGYELTREGAILVAAEQHYRTDDPERDPIERAGAALAAFRRFTGCSGERPQAVAFLGKLQTRFEMLDEAAEAFDSVRESFPDNPTFTYYAARIAEKRGHGERAAKWYRGILRSLDILRLRYRCSGCRLTFPDHADRCPNCRKWGVVSLDIGLHALREPLPAARPVYEVRGEEPEQPEEPAQHDLSA